MLAVVSCGSGSEWAAFAPHHPNPIAAPPRRALTFSHLPAEEPSPAAKPECEMPPSIPGDPLETPRLILHGPINPGGQMPAAATASESSSGSLFSLPTAENTWATDIDAPAAPHVESDIQQMTSPDLNHPVLGSAYSAEPGTPSARDIASKGAANSPAWSFSTAASCNAGAVGAAAGKTADTASSSSTAEPPASSSQAPVAASHEHHGKS